MIKKILKAYLKIIIPAKLRSRLRTIQKQINYFGLMYKCPICNSHLKLFLTDGCRAPVLKEKNVVGGGYRHKNLCPICGSLDRDRLLYLFLKHKTNIFDTPQKLLHIAPEARVAAILGAKVSIDYLTADLYSKDFMVTMDITDIQFPTDSFDAIICNHVLEHIIDDHKAISELYRTLKPGGWAILQVPISISLNKTFEDFSITTKTGREEAFGQEDHVRIYAMDYKDRLAQAGFKVNVFKWVTDHNDFGGHKNIFGLNEEECLFFVNKPV